MRRFLTLIILMAFFMTTYVASSYALPITSTVTADNHYALYVGDADGNVTLVGRNEIGGPGDPGTLNWSLPESFTFDLDDNSYIYVAGWSDAPWASGLIGQFTDADSNILFTTSSTWQVVGTGEDLGDGDPAPTTARMQEVIQNANSSGSWGAVVSDRLNGAAPWGTIPGITSSASWIWMYSYSLPLPDPGEFLVFRFKPTGLPPSEPSCPCDERLKALEETVADLQAKNTEQDQKIAILEERATNLESRVDMLEELITECQGALNWLEDTMIWLVDHVIPKGLINQATKKGHPMPKAP